MKKHKKAVFAIVILLCVFTGNAGAFDKEIVSTKNTQAVDVYVGPWWFTSDDAPNPLKTGELIIEKDDQGYSMQIYVLNEFIVGEEYSVSSEVIAFKFKVNGKYAIVEIRVNADVLTGIFRIEDDLFKIEGKKGIVPQ